MQYGDTVFATNYVHKIQLFKLGTDDAFVEFGGDSPRARYLGVVKNCLVAIDTVDEIDGARPQRIRWSDVDEPTSWTIDSVSQADFQDLYGNGGYNKAVVSGLTQSDATVLQERAIWRMTYTGRRPFIFEFDQVEGARGTPAHGSVILVGGVVYYLGEDGFYSFDGAQSVPIGIGKVDNTFLADANPTYFHRMYSASDIERKLIYWSYVSNSAISTTPDKIIMYNWSTGEWSLVNVSTEVLWHTIGFGSTLEDLDAFGTLEEIPVSFDSRVWQGGTYNLSAFDADHTSAHFSAGNMAARITTREITWEDPTREFVTQAWPHVEVPAAYGSVSIAVGTRKRTADAPSYGIATHMNPAGFCPQRVADQYMRFQMSVSASIEWSNAVGIDVRSMARRGNR